MKALHLLSRDFPHFGEHSGYHQFARALPATLSSVGEPARWLSWVLFRRVGLSFPRRRRTDTVAHYLYWEDMGYVPGPRARYVATLHQPVPVLARRRDLKRLSEMDLVLALTDSQVSFLQDCLPFSRVERVSHGVDTRFFRPPARPRASKEARILTVGSWLRDFPLLSEVRRAFPRASFRIIGDGETRVSDAELREAYRDADLFLHLPRLAGASNALMEAMASGLPIVSLDLPEVREYASREGTRYVAPDAGEIARALGELSESMEERRIMGTASRARSLDFSLERVAAHHLALYRSLVDDVENRPGRERSPAQGDPRAAVTTLETGVLPA